MPYRPQQPRLAADELIARSLIPPAKPPRRLTEPPLPLPTLTLPPAHESLVYGMGHVDPAGRIFDRVITRTLNWPAGTRVAVGTTAGLIVIRRDPIGAGTVCARSGVTIPALVRARCGVRQGDRILLAALPRGDLLVAYPPVVLDSMLRSWHADHAGPG